MKKIILSIAVSLIVLVAHAQEKKLIPSKLLKFEQVEHDFGDLKQVDGDVEYSFKFKNTSATALAISDVQPECGCTVPDKSRIPQEAIQPGDSAIIPISYAASTHPGEFYKKIKVITTKETFEIAIKGYVEPDNSEIAQKFPELLENGLRLSSTSIQFGTVYTNAKSLKDFEFFNGTSDTLRLVDSLVTFPEHITAVLRPDVVVPGTTGHLFLEYDGVAKNDYGYLVDYFQLQFDTAHEVIELAARATVQEYFDPNMDKAQAPKIQIASAEHDFGTAEKDAKVIHQYNFLNIGKSPLHIRKVKSTCACIEAVTDKEVYEPGEAGVVTITFDTHRRKGKQRKSTILIVNDPLKPVHTLKLTGSVKSE